MYKVKSALRFLYTEEFEICIALSFSRKQYLEGERGARYEKDFEFSNFGIFLTLKERSTIKLSDRDRCVDDNSKFAAQHHSHSSVY